MLLLTAVWSRHCWMDPQWSMVNCWVTTPWAAVAMQDQVSGVVAFYRGNPD